MAISWVAAEATPFSTDNTLGAFLAFLADEQGCRPVHGSEERYHSDPHWRELALFYEYLHGDTGAGLGASHQTGWTGLVTKLLQQSGE